MYKKSLTREQALQKLRHYCGYQERSHQEVRSKLFDLGVRRSEHDDIIAVLIEENYLNEERFALAYAGGKWRMKQWGRVRIRYALQQKKVSDYCINKALRQIGEEEYLQVLAELARERYRSLKGEQYLVRQKKTLDHLIARGFEAALIQQEIRKLRSGDEAADSA